jgi:hypothetical protein
MTRPPESPCCRGRKALLQALRSNPLALCPPAAKEPTPAAYATAARTHSTAAPDPNRLARSVGFTRRTNPRDINRDANWRRLDILAASYRVEQGRTRVLPCSTALLLAPHDGEDAFRGCDVA